MKLVDKLFLSMWFAIFLSTIYSLTGQVAFQILWLAVSCIALCAWGVREVREEPHTKENPNA